MARTPEAADDPWRQAATAEADHASGRSVAWSVGP